MCELLGVSRETSRRMRCMSTPLYVSMGNAKIDDSVALFDLPVVTTCPGAGECIKYCYAMKQEWWGEGRSR